ncbi:MAG: c-type cytochrome [Pseudomonadota bacterium]
MALGALMCLGAAPAALAPILELAAARAEPGGGYGRMEGHGGPVKSLAAHRDADGRVQALTASFDNALGFWIWADGAAERVVWLDGHEAAVTSAAFTPDGAAAVSGSDDFTVRFWRLQSGRSTALRQHQGKVADVAVSADGRHAASASWDGTVALWRLPAPGDRAGAPELAHVLAGHAASVNAVAFAADGETLFSASADGEVRRWRTADGALVRVEARHGFGVNRLLPGPADAAGAESWLAYGATDGVVRVLDLAGGDEIAALTGDRRPILALALSPDGARLAYGDGEGYISVVAVDGWRLERDFRAARQGPVWGLAYLDDAHLASSGLDDWASVWPVGALEAIAAPAAGDGAARSFQVDPETVSNGERQFLRKCSICHTVTQDGGRRAGPTLYAVFGRRAGAWPGYAYSDALLGSDLVWDETSLDKLFEIGPDHYTPGSKMPVQRIVRASDRADLIAYLREATAPEGAARTEGAAAGE